MPPASGMLPQRPLDTEHLLAPHRRRSPWRMLGGIVLILIVLGFGILYFWGANINQQRSAPAPADASA